MRKAEHPCPFPDVSQSIARGRELAQIAGKIKVVHPRGRPERDYNELFYGELFPLVEKALAARDDAAIAHALGLLSKWRLVPDTKIGSDLEMAMDQLLAFRQNVHGKTTYLTYLRLVIEEPVPVPGELSYFDLAGGNYLVDPQALEPAYREQVRVAVDAAVEGRPVFSVHIDPRLYSPAEILAANWSGFYRYLKRAHLGHADSLLDCVIPGFQALEEYEGRKPFLSCERYLLAFIAFPDEVIIPASAAGFTRRAAPASILQQAVNRAMRAPFPASSRVIVEQLRMGGFDARTDAERVADETGKMLC